MRAAIAAGHPATVEAGLEILGEGGSAADAAVAACLASCVAETVMTGLLGGGHAIVYDAASGRTRNLDFFVTVPGLGAEPREAELLELEVPFGSELVRYAVGIASCGVHGVPAGLEALHREHGRLPWRRLVEPALRLARDGVNFPPAHAACLAMLASVMTMNEGARIYSPGGELLPANGRLEQPGLVRALELLAEEGPRSAYDGSLAHALLDADGRARRTRHASRPRCVRGSLDRPGRGRLRGNALPHPQRLVRLAGGAPDSAAPAGPLSCRARRHAGADTRRCRPRRPHDEPRDTRLRRERLRPHDQPGPGIGRLPPRPRRAPEQHARRGRPDPRGARARQPHGQHDGAEPRASTPTASRSRAAPRAAPGCEARSSRSSPGSSTRG